MLSVFAGYLPNLDTVIQKMVGASERIGQLQHERVGGRSGQAFGMRLDYPLDTGKVGWGGGKPAARQRKAPAPGVERQGIREAFS